MSSWLTDVRDGFILQKLKSFDDSYEVLISELFKKHPSVQKTGFSSGAYKPGLDAMRRFAAVLGNPQDEYETVHVAGTNGKGSVCSLLAAALSGNGYKVGLYTSPHLVDFRERIKIISGDCGCEMIPKEEVLSFIDSYDTENLSFFEITTGMAFWWFAKSKVDVAVIEVGLGGRLDSTNIITPELSIITSIGLDHCALLGNTRPEIAREKAGIFKPGVPALVSGADDEILPVFEEIAAQVHCPLFVASEQPVSVDAEVTADMLDLKGPCQEENLKTVLAALDLLGEDVNADALERAAQITVFRGRWERLQENPEVICDIGHNPPALAVNFARLRDVGRPLVIVYGIMADKDLDAIAPLFPEGAEYVLAAPDTERSLDVDSLYSRLSQLRPELSVRTAPTVRDAVTQAMEIAAGLENPLVYIGGSTFVVSEAVASFAR